MSKPLISKGQIDPLLKNHTHKEIAKGISEELEKNPFDLKKEQKRLKTEKYSEISKDDLLSKIRNRTELKFLDQHGTPYIKLIQGEHKEIWPIRSRHVLAFITRVAYETTGQVPAQNMLTQVINILQAEAQFDGHKADVYLRYHQNGNELYLDLCNSKWQVLHITADKVEILDDTPIFFKRFGHMKELKFDPTANLKDIDLIFKYVPAQKSDKILLRPYLCTIPLSAIPIVMLIISGAHGAGKSFSVKAIRLCLDPSIMRTLSMPKDLTELVQQVSHHYFASYDNVSRLTKKFSDAFCRFVTGEGFSKRELYTDDDDIIYELQRKLAFNGINLAGEEPDFLDRALPTTLVRIDKSARKKEQDLWSEFQEDQPKITGAILKIIQQAFGIIDKIKPTELPRMADFAVWAEAMSQAMGEKPGIFMNKYWATIGDVNKSALEASSIGLCIMNFMLERREWKGTMSSLLTELETQAVNLNITTKNKDWPGAPHMLSRKLKVIETTLKEEGIVFERKHTEKGVEISFSGFIASETPNSDSTDSVMPEATFESGFSSKQSSFSPEPTEPTEVVGSGKLQAHDKPNIAKKSRSGELAEHTEAISFNNTISEELVSAEKIDGSKLTPLHTRISVFVRDQPKQEVKIDSVIAYFEGLGDSEADIEDAIAKAKEAGDIFEPKCGVLKTL